MNSTLFYHPAHVCPCFSVKFSGGVDFRRESSENFPGNFPLSGRKKQKKKTANRCLLLSKITVFISLNYFPIEVFEFLDEF